MKRTHLPLNGLRVLDAAARHLSFTRAADELAVTPAADANSDRDCQSATHNQTGTLMTACPFGGFDDAFGTGRTSRADASWARSRASCAGSTAAGPVMSWSDVTAPVAVLVHCFQYCVPSTRDAASAPTVDTADVEPSPVASS